MAKAVKKTSPKNTLNEMKSCLDRLIELYLDSELFDTWERLLDLAETCPFDFAKWPYKGADRLSYVKGLGFLSVQKYRQEVTLRRYIRKLKELNYFLNQKGKPSGFKELGELFRAS